MGADSGSKLVATDAEAASCREELYPLLIFQPSSLPGLLPTLVKSDAMKTEPRRGKESEVPTAFELSPPPRTKGICHVGENCQKQACLGHTSSALSVREPWTTPDGHVHLETRSKGSKNLVNSPSDSPSEIHRGHSKMSKS